MVNKTWLVYDRTNKWDPPVEFNNPQQAADFAQQYKLTQNHNCDIFELVASTRQNDIQIDLTKEEYSTDATPAQESPAEGPPETGIEEASSTSKEIVRDSP